MSTKFNTANRNSPNQRRLLDIASNSPEEALSDKMIQHDTAATAAGGIADDGLALVNGEPSKESSQKISTKKGTGSGDTENVKNLTRAMESIGESSKEQSGQELRAHSSSASDDRAVPPAASTETSAHPEKKVRITTPTKSAHTGSKKSKKSTPWYNVLTSTYRSKLDEFRKVFKCIPENERLVADYSCALQKDILVHGRMYVTENWICFYANIFRWETVLTVQLKDVTAITKERTIRFIPNALQVSTSTEKYFFASFMSRDKAFHLLFKVWQNALLSQTMTPIEYWSWIHKLYGSDLGLDEDELPDDYVKPEAESSSKEKERSKSESAIDGADDGLIVEAVDGADEDGELSKSEGEMQVEGEELSDQHSASDMEEGVDPMTLLDFEGKTVLDEYYNIPVDQLFTSVFAGEEPLYTKVLESNGSKDISVTEWKSDDEIEERSFYHNMMLSTGLTTKKCAVVERYSAPKAWLKPGKSYVLATSVQNKGVPYSDYFVVQVGHALTAVNSTKSHLRIILSVEFHKNPLGLMKNLIERGAESGVRKNKELMDKLIRTHLERQYKRKKTRKKSAAEESNEEDEQPNHRTSDPPVISAMKWVLPKQVSTQIETKSLHITTIIFISIGLFFLLVLNIYLYLQLQDLNRGQTRYPSVSLDQVMKSIQSLPEESREWLLLLHQQQQYHELEMKKWREIMAMSVDLMKQIENTFEELKSGIETSSSIPDISQLIMDMQQNMAGKDGSENKDEL